MQNLQNVHNRSSTHLHIPCSPALAAAGIHLNKGQQEIVQMILTCHMHHQHLCHVDDVWQWMPFTRPLTARILTALGWRRIKQHGTWWWQNPQPPTAQPTATTP